MTGTLVRVELRASVFNTGHCKFFLEEKRMICVQLSFKCVCVLEFGGDSMDFKHHLSNVTFNFSTFFFVKEALPVVRVFIGVLCYWLLKVIEALSTHL